MSKFVEFFKDIDDELSSKRLITFLSFLVMVITWIIDLFTNLSVTENVFDGFLWLTAFGLGTVVAEKFSHRKVNITKEDSDIDLSDMPGGE